MVLAGLSKQECTLPIVFTIMQLFLLWLIPFLLNQYLLGFRKLDINVRDIQVNLNGPENNELIFSLFPKPASNNLHVKFKDEVKKGLEIFIFNMQGKHVYLEVLNRGQNTEGMSIPLNGLGNGTYYLKIISGSKIGKQKFIVGY